MGYRSVKTCRHKVPEAAIPKKKPLMNIVIDLLRASAINGNQVYTLELTKALVSFFPEHHYHTLLYLNRKQEAEKLIGVFPHLHYRNILPHESLLGRPLKPLISSLINRIKKSAADRADIFHCTNPIRFPFGIKNSVVTLHDLIALRPEPWASEGSKAFYRKYTEKILQQAVKVFTVSEFTRQDAITRFPQHAEKFLTTPLAANTLFRCINTDRQFLTGYGIADPDKPYLLYVGEIQPRKNIPGMLRAINSLPTPLKKEIQLIMIGKISSAENRLMLEKELQPLQQHLSIHHLQNVPATDLVKFYNAAFAFLYISFYEGFGLPVIEAMSCGCPVLTSDTTSLREVAADAALTVNPHDQDALREGIIRLLHESELRKKLKKQGLVRAASYSWEQTARKTMDGYMLAFAG